MAVDPMELMEDDKDESKSRLNSLVAITVALLATFMGICSIKGGNIGQAMQQATADKIDNYSWYQARKIRADVYQATADELRLQAQFAPPAARAAYTKQAAFYDKESKEQNEKKDEQQKAAEQAQKDYEAYNVHDDQLDLSDALLSLALALLALTALTQKKWLFALALIPTAIGFTMGLAGLLGWGIRLDAISKLLS